MARACNDVLAYGRRHQPDERIAADAGRHRPRAARHRVARPVRRARRARTDRTHARGRRRAPRRRGRSHQHSGVAAILRIRSHRARPARHAERHAVHHRRRDAGRLRLSRTRDDVLDGIGAASRSWHQCLRQRGGQVEGRCVPFGRDGRGEYDRAGPEGEAACHRVRRGRSAPASGHADDGWPAAPGAGPRKPSALRSRSRQRPHREPHPASDADSGRCGPRRSPDRVRERCKSAARAWNGEAARDRCPPGAGRRAHAHHAPDDYGEHGPFRGRRCRRHRCGCGGRASGQDARHCRDTKAVSDVRIYRDSRRSSSAPVLRRRPSRPTPAPSSAASIRR